MSGPPLPTMRKRVYEIYRTAPETMDKLQLASAFINETYKKYIYPADYDKVNITLDSTARTRIIDSAAELAILATTPASTTY